MSIQSKNFDNLVEDTYTTSIMGKQTVHPDLHMHSVFSDGRFTPEQLVEMAKANSVNLLALTDHDEVAGNERMRAAAESAGIDFVSGIEISTSWNNHDIHIVGLDIDENNPSLVAFIQKVQNNRASRAVEIAKRLEKAGLPGALKGAMKFVTNPKLISRTHFAAWLCSTNAVSDWQKAFDKWLGKSRPAYVPLESVQIDEAVSLIQEAGGIPVMAHPGRYGLKTLQLQGLLTAFRSCGGNTIEVTTGSHSPLDVPVFTEIARQQKFEASTGSDFHRLGMRCEIGKQGDLAPDLTPVWHHFDLKYCDL